jgi:hypothetical protein
MIDRQRIVILGLSLTSSWGNGHATTYRGLIRELVKRRHHVTFLERDVPWYAENRDLPKPPYGTTILYRSVDELRQRHGQRIREADLVIVGSYVPDGIEAGHWVCSTARGVTAFYDIDTPVTLAALEAGTCTYLSICTCRSPADRRSIDWSGTSAHSGRVLSTARSMRPPIIRKRARRTGISVTWARTARHGSRRSSA